MGILGKIKQLFGRKGGEEPIYSFVMLLSQPRNLDAETLERQVSQALGVEFDKSLPDDQRTDFVIGAHVASNPIGQFPTFMVKLGGAIMVVNSIPRPYVPDPEKAAREITDGRLQKAMREHTAWLSVDWMGDKDDTSIREGYKLIGKLAAYLADSDCLAVYSTLDNQMRAFDEEIREALRSDDPLESFRETWNPPLINIKEDDPRMKLAVEEARQRWPEFVEAFSKRNNDQLFSIKAPVTDGRNTEFIWVMVAEIDGETIQGDLGNDPVDLQFMKLGDRVRVRLADLNDWAYTQDEKMIGGFTLKVLEAAVKSR